MGQQRPPESPRSSKIAIAFAIGVLLGVGFVIPVIQGRLSVASAESAVGPIGRVVFVGVLALAAVTIAFFGLLRLMMITGR